VGCHEMAHPCLYAELSPSIFVALPVSRRGAAKSSELGGKPAADQKELPTAAIIKPAVPRTGCRQRYPESTSSRFCSRGRGSALPNRRVCPSKAAWRVSRSLGLLVEQLCSGRRGCCVSRFTHG